MRRFSAGAGARRSIGTATILLEAQRFGEACSAVDGRYCRCCGGESLNDAEGGAKARVRRLQVVGLALGVKRNNPCHPSPDSGQLRQHHLIKRRK
jgi:hypothetical protein